MGHLLEGMVMFCCTAHSDTITVGSPSLSYLCSTLNGISCWELCKQISSSFSHSHTNRGDVGGECSGDHWPNRAVAHLKKKGDKSWDPWRAEESSTMLQWVQYQWFMNHEASAFSKFWENESYPQSESHIFSRKLLMFLLFLYLF